MNKYIKKRKSKYNYLYVFSITALFTICIMRIYRNSINNASTQVGGVWNIISFAFVCLFVLYFMTQQKLILNSFTCIKIGLFYALFVILHIFINLDTMSVNTVYNIGITTYFIDLTIVFYIISSYGIGDFEKKITVFIFYPIVIFVGILLFFRAGKIVDMIIYQSDVYFPLCMFPLILMWNKKKIIVFPIILISIVTILSNKRVAIISLVVGIIVYYLSIAIIENKIKKFLSSIIKMTFFSIIIAYAYNIISKTLNINLWERLMNIAVDGGSGRDEIYRGIWNAMLESDWTYWIFGYGLNAIYTVYGRNSGAHNDFLHVLYQYGIIPSFLLIIFYISLIILYFEMIKTKYTNTGAMGFSIILSFMMSMFSNYLISETHVTFMATFWGIILYDYKIFIYLKNNSGDNYDKIV